MRPKGPRPRAAVCAAAAVFSFCVTASSFAASSDDAPSSNDPASETILLIEAPHDPTGERIGAELTTLGFGVKTVQEATPAGGPVPLAEIELLTRTMDATATIAVDPATGATRVWTMDRAADRMVLRATLALGPDPAVAALRTVEALRTLLRPVERRAPVPPRPPSPSTEAEAEAKRPPATTPPRPPPSLGAALGPAFAASPGRYGSSWQGLVALRWLLRPSWGLEWIGVFPLTSATWSATEGSSSLTLGLAAVGLHWRPLTASWCLLDSAAGVGAAWLHTEASPHAGFLGKTTDTLVASPLVRLGYSVSLSPLTPLWLRADLLAALAVPRPVFLVAERTLSSWGRPLIVGSVGVEIALQ